jgi:hypothetical protein
LVFPRINTPNTTTADTFAGDALNKIQEWLAGLNIAASDSTNRPSINTDTRFQSGRFKLFDSDLSNEISFATPNLSTNASVTFPVLLSGVTANEILFASVQQSMENKTINAAANVITNITDTNIATSAAIAWAKVSKAGSSLGDLANVDLTGLANNYSIRWDASVGKWVVYSVATAIGETNTASNVGTGGVGIFKQKTLVDLQFKKINAGSTSVTVTDDTTNSEVDIDVVDATTTLKGKVRLAPSGDTTTGTVVQATDARLTDARTPTTHATSHKNGQADVIKINELGAGTANVTTTNTTIAANGTAPMLPNNSQLFLNGVGNWTEPIGTGSGVSGTGSILRGTTTKTGNGSTKVFTIAHGMGITPTAYFVHGNSVDALGAFTLSADSTNITVTYTVAPPTGTSNLAFTWVVLDSGTGSTVGEVNTYSSVGTGISIIKTKVGVDFPFKSLFAGSTRISITGNTNDVSLDVNQANLAIDYSQLTNAPISLVKMNQANVYGDFVQTLRSSRLKVMNPANTFGYLIAGSAITTTDRTLTLPLVTADDTFAVLALAQTLTNKTLTTPIIDAIKSGSFNFVVPSITANDTIVGRNTTDTLANKTLTNPTIATINNGVGVTITLPTNTTTIMGTSDTATVTNKTAVLSNNTLTDTGAVLGGIPIHNGTRYVNVPQGPQGTFLGVCGAGTLGYFTPDTGSGGTMPDGTATPGTGRWGALWGGTRTGRGIYDITATVSGTITYGVPSPTEATTIIATAASDDSIAELKTSEIFSRQSNLVFRAKWSLVAATNATIMIGCSGLSVLPTGGSHDTPLNNSNGVMVTCSLDIESVYQISRNDGTGTQVKVPTSIAANNTSSHTVEINVNSTNVTVILDTVSYGPYTVDIPALTTKMSFYMHIEAIGSTAKSLQVYRMQTTCL